MSLPYNKQPLTFQLQLDTLVARGLQVSDQQAALNTLSSVSYYRLSGYWFPFRIRDANHVVTDQLVPNTSFEQVLALYEFDRKLRLLVLDAIERVEVAIRTRITYHMGHAYGAYAHTDRNNFHPNFDHTEWLNKVNAEANRSSEEFIRHFQTKYSGFPNLPIWMATEVMSLGALSFFYKGLINDKHKGIEDKKAVADYFNIHHKTLADWLHSLTYIRNVCAHQSRLWNKELAIRPGTSKDRAWSPPITPSNTRIFYVLLMLRHLLRAAGNGNDWRESVTNHLETIATSNFYEVAMGLPPDWRDHPLWT